MVPLKAIYDSLSQAYGLSRSSKAAAASNFFRALLTPRPCQTIIIIIITVTFYRVLLTTDYVYMIFTCMQVNKIKISPFPCLSPFSLEYLPHNLHHPDHLKNHLAPKFSTHTHKRVKTNQTEKLSKVRFQQKQ